MKYIEDIPLHTIEYREIIHKCQSVSISNLLNRLRQRLTPITKNIANFQNVFEKNIKRWCTYQCLPHPGRGVRRNPREIRQMVKVTLISNCRDENLCQIPGGGASCRVIKKPLIDTS